MMEVVGCPNGVRASRTNSERISPKQNIGDRSWLSSLQGAVGRTARERLPRGGGGCSYRAEQGSVGTEKFPCSRELCLVGMGQGGRLFRGFVTLFAFSWRLLWTFLPWSSFQSSCRSSENGLYRNVQRLCCVSRMVAFRNVVIQCGNGALDMCLIWSGSWIFNKFK